MYFVNDYFMSGNFLMLLIFFSFFAVATTAGVPTSHEKPGGYDVFAVSNCCLINHDED